MSVRALLVITGLFCVLAGITVILFAGQIQDYTLRYQPSPWARPFWTFLRDHLPFAGPVVRTQLRLAGLTGFVMGVIMLALAFGFRP